MSIRDDRERHSERIAQVRRARQAEKVGYPIRIRHTELVRTQMVGTGLVRLTVGGPGVEGFEAHAPDEHVKLIFPEESGELRLPEPDGPMLRWPRPMPTTREYTVRRYDPVRREIDFDVALHAGGLAADWARRVEPGESVHVAGPPGGLIVPHAYDRYLLAGDITALPAIARWLEELPRAAAGWVFIEVGDASEEIDLDPPEPMHVQWLHRGAAAPGQSDVLYRAVTSVPVPRNGRTFVWLAGEAGVLKPLRRWIRDEWQPVRGDYDITGYWKRGAVDYDDPNDEHGHHHRDHHDAEHDHDHSARKSSPATT